MKHLAMFIRACKSLFSHLFNEVKATLAISHTLDLQQTFAVWVAHFYEQESVVTYWFDTLCILKLFW